jgi:hypothetical protein
VKKLALALYNWKSQPFVPVIWISPGVNCRNGPWGAWHNWPFQLPQPTPNATFFYTEKYVLERLEHGKCDLKKVSTSILGFSKQVCFFSFTLSSSDQISEKKKERFG